MNKLEDEIYKVLVEKVKNHPELQYLDVRNTISSALRRLDDTAEAERAKNHLEQWRRHNERI